MLVEPVAPYVSATPYRKKAVANDPSRKYLMEASTLPSARRRNPASTYVEIDEISSAMKISTSSTADDISIIPDEPSRINPKNSPLRMSCAFRYSNEASMTTAATKPIIRWKQMLKLSTRTMPNHPSPCTS